MKKLLILGAGGMGKEVYYIAQHSVGYGKDFVVKGFLDFDNPNWDTNIYPPIISIEDTYSILPDDVFICSVGDVHLKQKICEKMIQKGAQFISLISTEAEVRTGSKVGIGCIIDSHVILGSDTRIGNHCLIQGYSCIGHDCIVGNYTRIDPKVSLVGGVKVGDNVIIHTAAILNHKVTVGNNAVIGAMSFVILKVKGNESVFGIPAKRIDY